MRFWRFKYSVTWRRVNVQMPTFRKSFLPPSSGFERFYTAVEIQQRTRRNIPEHSNLHHHRCQNLSYVVQTYLRASFSIFTGFRCHELRLPEINMDCQISQDIVTYGKRRYKGLHGSTALCGTVMFFIKPFTSHVLYIGSPLCQTWSPPIWCTGCVHDTLTKALDVHSVVVLKQTILTL